MSYFKVELSFGHRRRTGELLPQQHVVAAEQQALERFTELFQGGQLHRRLGGFMLDDHLVLEPCSLIYSVTEAVDGQVAQLWSFASNLAALLDQNCILVTVTPMAGLVGWVQPQPV